MIREAEKHAASDAEKKDLIEVVNNAESVLHDTESNLDEFGSQLNQAEVSPTNFSPTIPIQPHNHTIPGRLTPREDQGSPREGLQQGPAEGGRGPGGRGQAAEGLHQAVRGRLHQAGCPEPGRVSWIFLYQRQLKQWEHPGGGGSQEQRRRRQGEGQAMSVGAGERLCCWVLIGG